MSSQLSLTKLHRDILKMAKEMVEPFKGICWIESAGKHHRLYVEISNTKRFTTLAKTPCQMNYAIQHKRNDLKKLIKEMVEK